MAADSLTTLNWLHDQRRFIAQSPMAPQVVSLLRAIYSKSLSGDGISLCVRVVRAALAATTELEPVAGAPIAHRVAYGLVRRSLWFTLLALVAAVASGTDEPVLSEAALASLISLETQDPLAGELVDRLNLLATLYIGFSWRVTAIELGLDLRTAGAAAVVGGGAPGGGIGGAGSTIHEFAANIGDGVATAIPLTHGLNTQDVIVIVRQATTPFNVVYPDVAITNANVVTLTFTTAPTVSQFRVVVLA